MVLQAFVLFWIGARLRPQKMPSMLRFKILFECCRKTQTLIVKKHVIYNLICCK